MPPAEPASLLSPEARNDAATKAARDDGVFLNLSGYRFIDLEHLPVLQADLEAELLSCSVLGTILLADEGINVAISGTPAATEAARACLEARPELAGLWLKESRSDTLPFSKLKVRVRHEIIAFDGGELSVTSTAHLAPAVSPADLRSELDSSTPPQLLDTRNTYEIAAGGFTDAKTLGIDNFRDFRQAVDTAVAEGSLSLDAPLVTFCTGGIRCEKAAPWLVQRGFKDVRQIEGGILNWLKSEGQAHWQGDCFVFDDRVAIDASLTPTGKTLCSRCHHAVARDTVCHGHRRRELPAQAAATNDSSE